MRGTESPCGLSVDGRGKANRPDSSHLPFIPFQHTGVIQMRTQPTFTSTHSADRTYVVLVCRETGQRYSFSDSHPYDSVPIFRDGSVMGYRRGKAAGLGFIESDARWQIRQDRRNERAETTGHRA